MWAFPGSLVFFDGLAEKSSFSCRILSKKNRGIYFEANCFSSSSQKMSFQDLLTLLMMSGKIMEKKKKNFVKLKMKWPSWMFNLLFYDSVPWIKLTLLGIYLKNNERMNAVFSMTLYGKTAHEPVLTLSQPNNSALAICKTC